jgi:streptogramin lyase
MIGAILSGIHGLLVADGTISTAVGGRIYAGLAPYDATQPWVVLTIAAGGDINISPKDELDVDLTVKAISTDALTAQTIADAIRAALHDADPTLAGGWQSFRLQHTIAFMYSEMVDQRQYWHAGGNYRLRAVKEG